MWELAGGGSATDEAEPRLILIILVVNSQMIKEQTKSSQCASVKWKKKKLDGVGPVNNRPFTNKLQHIVKKKN